MHHTGTDQFVDSAVTFPEASNALKSLVQLYMVLKEAGLTPYSAYADAFLYTSGIQHAGCSEAHPVCLHTFLNGTGNLRTSGLGV